MAQIGWTISKGPPSDSDGAQGDMNFDYQGRIVWGPKGATSWAGTANTFTGQTGPVGPAASLPVVTTMGQVFAPEVTFATQTMGTTVGAANSIFTFAGSTIPNTFTPQANSFLVGVQATNHGATNATVYFYLQDLTANQTVYNYNSGNGLAAGTVAAVSYGNTTYPLIAGHTYQWQGIRASAGTTTFVINPIILAPSGTPSLASGYPPFVLASSTTVANNQSIQTFAPGMQGYQQYYKSANPTWLYQVDVWLAGSGLVTPFLYNYTAGANHWVTPSPYITLTSTPTKYTYGPFAPNAWPFVANSGYYMNLYAQNGSLTVTQCYAQITVGQ